jgi:hypothetical protein
MKQLKYIVTGTGRCGTVYAAMLLSNVMVSCGHESIFTPGGIETALRRLSGEEKCTLSFCSTNKRHRDGTWTPLNITWVCPNQIVADSSYMAAPYVGEFQSAKLVHLVRHPVRVVNSFCNYLGYFKSSTPSNEYEKFIYGILPELTEEMSQYDRGALYYILWNDLIEQRTENKVIHRIEDGPKKLLKELGLQNEICNFDDPYTNSFQKPRQRFCVDDLSEEIWDLFKECGAKYGYKLSSEYLLI